MSFTQALTGIHIHISGRRCRFYPIKVFLKRFKSDIDTSCSFCDDPNETDMHIFWDCPHTQIFWIEFSNVINRNVLQGFSLLFKDVLFGFFNIQKYQINEYFIINHYYFLLHFIFTAVNSLIKFLYLLFLKKKEVQQYIQTISFPRILKLSKQLIYFIFLTYSVKALFLDYLLLHACRNGALRVMSPVCT